MSTPISQKSHDDPGSEKSTQSVDSPALEALEKEAPSLEPSPPSEGPSKAQDSKAQEKPEAKEKPATKKIPTGSPPITPVSQMPTRAKKGSRGLSIVLGLLLLVSLGFNYWLWTEQTRLDARSDEYQSALEMAVERLDEQTARALAAEGSLSEVDAAVGTVRERISDLQSALDELSAATER